MFFFIFMPPAAATEDSRFIVRDVTFSGVSRIDKKALAAALVTSPPPVWKFWKDPPVITRQTLADDVLRIEQYYRNQGYYQASAEYEIKCSGQSRDAAVEQSPPDASGKSDAEPKPERLSLCDVMFRVHEGEPVHIRSIKLECGKAVPTVSRRRIKSELPFKNGDIFTADDYEDAKSAIRQLLGNKGYPFARVSGEAVVELAAHSVDITFAVDPGKLYYFGKVNISGHKGYISPKVIERSLAFQPGQQYSRKVLDQSRRNLFDLRVFQTAVIEPGEPNKEARTVPLHIRVKPRQQHSVKLGIGYGTEDGLRLKGGWSYRNLTGHADRFSLSAKRSDLQEIFQGEYLYPYFLSDRNTLITKTGYERDKAEYYTLQKFFANADLRHELGDNWTTVLGYDLTVNRPESIDTDETELDYESRENYRISAMRLDLERNTVSDKLNPSKGTVFRIGMEQASGYLESEIDYIRPGVEAKAYIPLPWHMVLAARVSINAIREAEDTDEVPVFKQLYLGGSKTVRGYAYQQLGVIDSNDQPVGTGGLSSLNANIELRYPIYKKFSGVAFVDTGLLDDASFRYNFKRMRYSCGFGLRYDTVIGPVQADFGYKLNPPGDTKSSDPEIQSLANPDRWRVHVNIGQAF